MSEMGDLSEIRAEMTIQWKIKDFLSISDETDTHFESSKFYFSGASWKIRIYPNGETKNESTGWISIYLMRMSSGSPVNLNFSFNINIDSKTNLTKELKHLFRKRENGLGIPTFIKREIVLEKKCVTENQNALTIICTLKNSEPNAVSRSLYYRLQSIGDNLRAIYLENEKTDIELACRDGNLCVHQVILKKHSPVFAAMFAHDTKESQTGEVSIVDIDRATMNDLLIYIYSGDIALISVQQTLSIYIAAEKYDIKHIKDICKEFIINNLSVECVCDIIKFSELYEDKEISQRGREFFKENAIKILESDSWKNFSKENHELSVELLGSLVQTLLSK